MHKLILPGLWRFTKLGYKTSRKRWNPLSACLEGKRALVTGATSGVGLAAARELAAFGAHVTIVARDEAKAEQVCDDLRRQTGNPLIDAEIADMSLMADVHALADRLLKAGEPIDMLINNAGAGRWLPLIETKAEDARAMIDVPYHRARSADSLVSAEGLASGKDAYVDQFSGINRANTTSSEQIGINTIFL